MILSDHVIDASLIVLQIRIDCDNDIGVAFEHPAEHGTLVSKVP
jgi:hypothetical protein